MKEKYFWIGITIVVISWIGNYFYFQEQQIETPIFLEHYYERESQSEYNMSFYYITNLNDPREVRYVIIDGIELYPRSDFPHFFWHNEQQLINYHQQFSHQGIREVHFIFMEDLVESTKDADGNWSFSEITVFFNDGTSTTQNIGEVMIREGREYDPTEEEVVQSAFSSGGSDGSNETGFRVLKDASVTEVEIPFVSEVSDKMSFKVAFGEEKIQWQHDEMSWQRVNGRDDKLFPISLKQGDGIYVTVQIHEDYNKPLDFPVKIMGESTDGTPFINHAYINRAPYLTSDEVKEMIANFEGGGE